MDDDTVGAGTDCEFVLGELNLYLQKSPLNHLKYCPRWLNPDYNNNNNNNNNNNKIIIISCHICIILLSFCSDEQSLRRRALHLPQGEAGELHVRLLPHALVQLTLLRSRG